MAPTSNEVFRAVADSNRRQLIDLLSDSERPVGEMVNKLRLSYSAVSQHLSVLRRAGLVQRRALGVQRLYRLNAAPLKEVYEWSRHYQGFWTSRLTRLRRYVDNAK